MLNVSADAEWMSGAGPGGDTGRSDTASEC